MVEVTTMTEHEHDHPVANPDRTVLDDGHNPEHASKPEKRAQDQPWHDDVAEEVKEAVENADGPL
jgi:hypothetical protein